MRPHRYTLRRATEPLYKLTQDSLTFDLCELQSQPLSTATLLDREACYRAIGEGFAHVGQHVDFTVWYTEELQGLLQQGYNVSRQ